MLQTTRLLDGARAGDRSALDALFARHRGRLLSWLRLALSPALARRVSAEDLLQETLLEATRKIASFEPRGPASFYAWLVAIGRFKIAEAQRALQAHKRAREEELQREPENPATSPSLGAMRRESAEALWAALAELPPEQAEAIRLRYLEGLPLGEAAARLGRSEAALKALVTRGFARLADKLDSGSA